MRDSNAVRDAMWKSKAVWRLFRSDNRNLREGISRLFLLNHHLIPNPTMCENVSWKYPNHIFKSPHCLRENFKFHWISWRGYEKRRIIIDKDLEHLQTLLVAQDRWREEFLKQKLSVHLSTSLQLRDIKIQLRIICSTKALRSINSHNSKKKKKPSILD